jgi:hypothetical protein
MRALVLGLAMIPLRCIGFRIQREGAEADPTPESFKSFTQTQSCELGEFMQLAKLPVRTEIV